MKRVLVLLVLSAILLSGCASPTVETPTTGGVTVVPPAPTPTPAVPHYTFAQIEGHSHSSNCWVAIRGKVYDVTLLTISGMDARGKLIMDGCGTDATALFESQSNENAHELFSTYYIGDIAE